MQLEILSSLQQFKFQIFQGFHQPRVIPVADFSVILLRFALEIQFLSLIIAQGLQHLGVGTLVMEILESTKPSHTYNSGGVMMLNLLCQILHPLIVLSKLDILQLMVMLLFHILQYVLF